MDHAPAELFAKWRKSFFSAYPTERSSSRCSAKIVFLIEICIENFVSIVFFVVKRSVRSSSSEMHREAVPGFYPNEDNFLLSPSYEFGCDNFQVQDPTDAKKPRAIRCHMQLVVSDWRADRKGYL